MKRFCIVLAALLVSVSSFAQFGIVGGLTSSSATIRNAVADYKNINQFHIGVAYKFSGKAGIFAVQPALVYNMKGNRLSSISSVSDLNLDYKTGFIELPVQCQVGVGLASVLRLYGFVEPFVGYAVSNQATFGDISYNNWDNVMNRFECGVGLGGGLELFRHVQVSVRYFWNFGSIYGKSTVDDFSINENSCRGVMLTGAILF